MKIIGFVNNNDGWEMVLKGDSCLLNNRKPFFIPDNTNEIGMTPCWILRVSRLGKEIALKFADRYYDAIAPGADFVALDLLRAAQAAGKPWTPALAFDYSLAVGKWSERVNETIVRDESRKELTNGRVNEWLLSPEKAIVEASKVMTIRQGDLIYIQERVAPRVVQKEEIVRVEIDGEEKLYCKIK